MIGEEDYLESITKQSPFFVDHASMLPSMKRDHWIAESLIPDTWYVTRREPWTYVSSPNGKMRVNGWKIHLSATKENAEKILVVPELLRTLVFARPCGGDQFAAGTVSPSLDMSR
ncbi:hypothetical protein [Bifidobacterium longum]|uniref:class III lanthionine synthetase LanKC N-terminal domain-containing protein n=1 Tax=Bifidobacterium longum TaxID=216816 RepID=UPI003EBA4823